MKSILAQLVLLRYLLIDWVGPYSFRYCAVKGRVKICNILSFWKSFHARFDNC